MKEVLTPKEKEQRLIGCRKANPDYDIMAIQDALIKTDWIIEDANEYLKQHCRSKIRYNVSQLKPTVQQISTTPSEPVRPMQAIFRPVQSGTAQETPKIQLNGTIPPAQDSPNLNGSKKSYSRIRRPASENDSGPSDYDDKPSEPVFDSDESDDEAEFMTKSRKAVFEFMNNGKIADLCNVKTLSQRKADFILELRPFESWGDLLTKIKQHRLLSTEVLNNTQEYLDRRNNLTNIMKKCNKIVRKIGKAVEQQGGSMLKQPEMISDG